MVDIICSLSQFVELFARNPSNSRYFYRGVKDAENHQLIPSIGRSEYGLKIADHTGEKEIFHRFVREVQPYIDLSRVNDFEKLALAQHFGVPTRILDWSSNALIALFFSVYQTADDENVDGAVHMLTWKSGAEISSGQLPIDPFKIDRVQMIYPFITEQRISAQHSVFSIQPDPKQPLNEFVENNQIQKTVIDAHSKKRIRSELSNIGINESSVFPGPDGIGRHLAWLHRNN